MQQNCPAREAEHGGGERFPDDRAASRHCPPYQKQGEHRTDAEHGRNEPVCGQLALAEAMRESNAQQRQPGRARLDMVKIGAYPLRRRVALECEAFEQREFAC